MHEISCFQYSVHVFRTKYAVQIYMMSVLYEASKKRSVLFC